MVSTFKKKKTDGGVFRTRMICWITSKIYNKEIVLRSPIFTPDALPRRFYKPSLTNIYDYFPHYHLQTQQAVLTVVVQINKYPKFYQCMMFGLQHVSALVSGTLFILLLLAIQMDLNSM
ncbi:unnamed protein product [Absidia cylindrospora]